MDVVHLVEVPGNYIVAYPSICIYYKPSQKEEAFKLRALIEGKGSSCTDHLEELAFTRKLRDKLQERLAEYVAILEKVHEFLAVLPRSYDAHRKLSTALEQFAGGEFNARE